MVKDNKLIGKNNNSGQNLTKLKNLKNCQNLSKSQNLKNYQILTKSKKLNYHSKLSKSKTTILKKPEILTNLIMIITVSAKTYLITKIRVIFIYLR